MPSNAPPMTKEQKTDCDNSPGVFILSVAGHWTAFVIPATPFSSPGGSGYNARAQWTFAEPGNATPNPSHPGTTRPTRNRGEPTRSRESLFHAQPVPRNGPVPRAPEAVAGVPAPGAR